MRKGLLETSEPVVAEYKIMIRKVGRPQ